ncbi:MAG: hypothetical protein IBX55_18785 [Methyloprofundus sp.]|uniref:hypothetical protein n=1 Tax=Thiomicrospira sp. TaxID=935 RepID=UPI0019E6946C|nr:hypothetical protein [Methyloprofundus sp.]
MNDVNMDTFEGLAGSAEIWMAIMLGLAVSTLLARSAFMLLGHLKLFQTSSIDSGDMAISVFKIGLLLVGGLVYFTIVT